MKSVVVDASVILKWVLPPDNEPHQTQALELRDAFINEKLQLFVPTLWYFEVGNLLSRIFPEQAGEQLKDLTVILESAEKHSSPNYQSEILRLTKRYGVTFYDASYHALAIVEKGALFTADEKYLRAISKEPFATHIREWKRPDG